MLELLEKIAFEDFVKVDIRLGTIIKVEPNLKAKKLAYKVWVDFGVKIGVLQTSAQITKNYDIDNLIGMNVFGCVNLFSKNIAGFKSEFLLLGVADEQGGIVLAGLNNPISKVETSNGQPLI